MERAIYAYTYIQQPFDEAARILIEDPATLLQSATDRAATEARELHADLRAELGHFEIGRDVTVELGEFRPTSMQTVTVPITWRATESTSLFPSLAGVVELQALSLRRPLAQLTLSASYRPPLGLLGAAGDALLGRHIADAVAHRFVHDVAHRIEAVLGRRPAVGAV